MASATRFVKACLAIGSAVLMICPVLELACGFGLLFCLEALGVNDPMPIVLVGVLAVAFVTRGPIDWISCRKRKKSA
ncbi:MAG: hypothetical protein IT450_06880 [Phycisphaerales bacterium]|nr:hypothetical protein [Phycisphaerales bacterium]